MSTVMSTVPGHGGDGGSREASLSSSSRRRRFSPSSPHLQNLSMPLSLSIADNDNDQNEPESWARVFSNDEEVMTPKSCALSISKTKVIVMGQVLSLVLVSD